MTAAAEARPIVARGRWRDRRAIRTWLYIVALMVVAMVVVGGATRLTGSGLSITEWKPIHGVIPPLNEGEWQEEFARYKQIPQYEIVNPGMTLAEFQAIFWWEWGHRLLGRLIGVVVLAPLAFFWITGRLEPQLKPKMVAIFLLGALQGAVGWWMVASGLTERVSVSQYRLTVHLTLACAILAYVVWVARSIAPPSTPSRWGEVGSPWRADASLGEPGEGAEPLPDRPEPPHPVSLGSPFGLSKRNSPLPTGERSIRALLPSVRLSAGIIVALVFVQIALGGLVAGLDAGLTFNTWPLMDGRLVPSGLFLLDPWWANFGENHMTVQFVHRLGAYVLFAAALVHAVRASWSDHATGAWVLLGLVTLQAAIGVAALVHVVPLSLALLHQLGAVVVLWVAVAHLRALLPPLPVPG